MRRRHFIAGIGSVAAWPVVARAQQVRMPVIGFLSGGSLDTSTRFLAAFRAGLGEFGYVEGHNVGIEYHWLGGQYDPIPALVADLIRRRVAVIATPGSTSATLAAKAATATIPIVFAVGGDPVELGLVANFNRPGGNVTGVSFLNVPLTAKRVELLHVIVPTATSIGFIIDPTGPQFDIQKREAEIAARILGVRLVILNASTPGEIEAAFGNLVRQPIGAILTGSDPLIFEQGAKIAALAAHHAVPVIYSVRAHVEAGGLMSYAANLFDAYHLTGTYAGRILKGEKPADLPVQRVTKIELVINLKTAKALGLTIPETLLATADEVIQ
jgi:putative ABC transport system substrate-binding protein